MLSWFIWGLGSLSWLPSSAVFSLFLWNCNLWCTRFLRSSIRNRKSRCSRLHRSLCWWSIGDNKASIIVLHFFIFKFFFRRTQLLRRSNYRSFYRDSRLNLIPWLIGFIREDHSFSNLDNLLWLKGNLLDSNELSSNWRWHCRSLLLLVKLLSLDRSAEKHRLSTTDLVSFAASSRWSKWLLSDILSKLRKLFLNKACHLLLILLTHLGPLIVWLIFIPWLTSRRISRLLPRVWNDTNLRTWRLRNKLLLWLIWSYFRTNRFNLANRFYFRLLIYCRKLLSFILIVFFWSWPSNSSYVLLRSRCWFVSLLFWPLTLHILRSKPRLLIPTDTSLRGCWSLLLGCHSNWPEHVFSILLNMLAQVLRVPWPISSKRLRLLSLLVLSWLSLIFPSRSEL